MDRPRPLNEALPRHAEALERLGRRPAVAFTIVRQYFGIYDRSSVLVARTQCRLAICARRERRPVPESIFPVSLF
jgi:hypothetical protein